MSTKTISGTITGGYTLGAGYTALLITAPCVVDGAAGGPGGEYLPGGAGGAALVIPYAVDTSNYGSIAGGQGGTGGNSGLSNGPGAGGVGGAGVVLTGGVFANLATVVGGAGGTGGVGALGAGGVGGTGGVGMSVTAGGVVTNSGAISGGAGGTTGDGESGGTGGSGGAGLYGAAGATVTNTGVISGGGGGLGGNGSVGRGPTGAAGDGAVFTAGGVIVNGSTSAATAVIEGTVGVSAAGGTTVANYATIAGTGGVSVQLGGAGDRLVAEAGSVFIGRIAGGGGTLELAATGGTLSGLGAAAATVSGALAASVSGFTVYQIDVGPAWMAIGSNTLGAAQTLLVEGGLTIANTFTNLGLISSPPPAFGLYLASDATLINGSASDTDAAINGYYGIIAEGTATVVNYGILTSSHVGISGAPIEYGVSLEHGGSLTNKAGALISGDNGVIASHGATVVNFGTLQAATGYSVQFSGAGDNRLVAEAGSVFIGVAAGYGGVLELAGGAGTLSGAGAVATLSGAVSATVSGFGQYRIVTGADLALAGVAGAATFAVYGTIAGAGGGAIQFTSTADRLIVGSGASVTDAVQGGGGALEFADGGGVFSLGAAGASGGGISIASSDFGAYQLDAGTWTMSGANTLAVGAVLLDEGALAVAGTLHNSGTLDAQGATITVNGVVLGGAVSALATASGGMIHINNAASVQAAGALTNAGAIVLTGATSLTDLRILAGGATLSSGGTITMSGPKTRILGISATATLTNANNTIVGVGSIGANDLTLINQAPGVIEATGLLTVRDAAGHTLTNSGLMEANATGKLALVSETINQAGGGTILAATGLVTLQGVDFIGGTLTTTGAGRINVDGGGATLDGSSSVVTNAGLLQVTGGETLTIDGSVINSGKLDLHAAKLLVTAAGVTLSGAGQVNLNDSASNIFVGTTAVSTLTNVNDRIAGSGDIGDGSMVLINNAAGQIIGNQGVALTIDTGANAITNAGLIENSGKGGTLVKSAVNNTGTLKAVTAGTLTLQGAVTGAGVAQINGGTLYVVGAFAENVTFTGTTGVLKLGDSVAYAGKVTGLSKTGANSLDLADIAFSNTKTKASFSGTTASGVLTVTDGTHTAKITLVGDYLGSTFTVSTDGHTGTKVVDPSAPAGPAPLAQAMAGFGRGGDVDLNRALHGPPSAFAPLLAHAGHRCAPV